MRNVEKLFHDFGGKVGKLIGKVVTFILSNEIVRQKGQHERRQNQYKDYDNLEQHDIFGGSSHATILCVSSGRRGTSVRHGGFILGESKRLWIAVT